MKRYSVFFILLVVGFFYWRISHHNLATEENGITGPVDSAQPTNRTVKLEPPNVIKVPPNTVRSTERQKEHTEGKVLETLEGKTTLSQRPRPLLPDRVKSFSDLSKIIKAEQFSSLEDLLNGLYEVKEFRPNANESIWNGNYYGSLGWSDQIPGTHLRAWPAVINLEFKRLDDFSPLTCLGILSDQVLLRFTKGAGKFVPLSNPNIKNYFVFRINTSHYLQVLLSDDHLGLAVTLYIQDPKQGLVSISNGVFKKNKSPSESETACQAE